MGTLVNGEFELRGVQFGTLRSGYPLVPGGFTVSDVDWRTADQPNPNGNGRMFGRDFVEGVTYTWQLQIVEDYPTEKERWAAASRRVSEFKRLWRQGTHESAQAVDMLRLWHGDRVGRVYGRTRRFSVDRTQLRKGLAVITCDFVAGDDLVYEDKTESVSTNLLPATGGGLVAPLTSPILTVGKSSGKIVANVGGEESTPAIIRFNGPITDPSLEVVGLWTVGLNYTIPYDRSVTVDSRLSARSVLRNGGLNLAGRLTANTPPLPDLKLPPGSYEVVLRGVDPTSTATATLTWYDARHGA